MTHRSKLAAIVIALSTIAVLAARARAIELFTNFNNGTELGTRPLDVDEMSPVRVHPWQGRWFHGRNNGCFNPAAEYGAAAQPGQFQGTTSARRVGTPVGPEAQARNESQPPTPALAGRGRLKAELQRKLQPTVVEPTGTKPTGRRPDSTPDDKWLRSSNFLPPTDSN
jgi:hypothetical protein